MNVFRGRTPEELITISIALVCLCGQIPFGLYRLWMGDYLIAGIDFIGAIICTAAIYQVHRHRDIKVSGMLMSVSAVLGVLFIVNREGVESVQFIFPVVVVTYFLIKPKQALILSGVAVLGLYMTLHSEVSGTALVKIVIPLLACSLFAYLFAAIRNSQNKQLQQLSTRDPLTGALNRRSLDERLGLLMRQAKRQPIETVLMILDLDNFKQINDKQGHVVGDRVLVRVANTLSERVRATDEIYRFGGDEFVIVVNDSSLQQCLLLAEDLRSRVEATEAMEGSHLSISIGLASYQAGLTKEQWVASADAGLLKAKEGGRNTVVTVSEL